MKERPLLITTSLIQPTLQDVKTLTSRLPGLEDINEEPEFWELQEFTNGVATFADRHYPNRKGQAKCPYAVDRLWVKETWATEGIYDDYKPSELPEDQASIWYAADGNRPDWTGKLRPSIFMTRWLSRIDLKVLNIEPRRAHSLTEKECQAEGVEKGIFRMGPNTWRREFQLELDFHGTYRDGYKYAFAKINGLDTWEKNPWVWLISFKRLK